MTETYIHGKIQSLLGDLGIIGEESPAKRATLRGVYSFNEVPITLIALVDNEKFGTLRQKIYLVNEEEKSANLVGSILVLDTAMQYRSAINNILGCKIEKDKIGFDIIESPHEEPRKDVPIQTIEFPFPYTES